MYSSNIPKQSSLPLMQMKAKRNYYIAQITGWSVYILVSTAIYVMSGASLSISAIGGIYLAFALGITVTHLYRLALIKLGWLDLDMTRLVPRVLAACAGLAIGFHFIYLQIGSLAFGWEQEFRWNDQNLFAWGMLFFIWNLIYFMYIFFQRFRNVEIKNLKLEAARNEYELRRLRDQMNPHFIFNAMNTIRALIEEDPTKAKKAVTQLSNVLRSSLQTGKQELITLKREMQIVSDYLDIEKARYEERLKVNIDIEQAANSVQIPPLILQTIVENCIKHGIAKLPKGGSISLRAARHDDHVAIDIFNDGQYIPGKETDASLGLENTRNRLDLSFGNAAWLTIGNADDSRVKTHIHLPLHKEES